MVSLNPLELRLPSRAWKVKLVGEGADDAGGVFDDTITEMCQVGWKPEGLRATSSHVYSLIFPLTCFCGNKQQITIRFHQELQSGVVDLLIHTPNGFADVGSNTDRCAVCYPLLIVTAKTVASEYNVIFSINDLTSGVGCAPSKVPVEPSGILR